MSQGSKNSSELLNDEKSPSESSLVVGNSTNKEYSCKYCGTTYKSIRAFAGHQNAHKDKRYPNMYFHRKPHFMNTPMIPRFQEPYYRQPTFSPYRPSFLGSNVHMSGHPTPNMISQRIPIPIHNHQPLNLISQKYSEFEFTNSKDQEPGMNSSNRGDLIDFLGVSYGVNNDEGDSHDGDDSLDLTLKL